jgi:predicted dehydrogenase
VCSFDQVAGLHDALRALADLLMPEPAPQGGPKQRSSPVIERTARPAPRDARVEATLFGYGHHARTALIPNLTRRFALTCVHEVDPSRLPDRPAPWAWDTASAPRTDDRAALTVSAGWHHTHAAIAASALKRGAWALIEKPAVTSRADLKLLLDALSAQPASRLFVAYHKRYAVEGAHLRDDLQLGQPGPPMRYHATVHVVRLPPRHWYRWPVSGSRLLSNGCHYIDHFLWLNDWSPVASYDVLPSPEGAAHIQITLESGAWMTLTLSDSGSDRLGTRELIEISRGERTARIVDARYTAEDSRRVLRSVALDRMAPYARMIDAVADRIAAGLPGDSPESVRMTHQLALDLDAALLARQVPR